MVRPTWAPEGQTPGHYNWDRYDRLSALSALTVSACRKRLGRYFDIHDHNIVTEDSVWFAEQILARLQRRIILLIDRRPGHRSGARRLLERFPKRVWIEWLPPYASELNPVAQVWNRSK